MAHYSSQLLFYEDELKNSLKGISVKPLVSASYAQFGVDAEDENPGQHVTAYVNSTHDSWRPILVVLYYEMGRNLYCGESYVQCSLS